jgi:hypothetical protein
MTAPAGDRLIIDPDTYLVDCFRLARQIWEDGYRPDFLVGLWRGGAPPGIAVQEYFRWKGHDLYHTAIRTQSLEGLLHGDGYDIKGLEHVLEIIAAEHRLLLVDDFFDTGRTIYEVVRHLRRKARRNSPEVRVAVVYYRPRRRRYQVGPNYYVREVESRPLLPDRLTQLTEDELRARDPELHEAVYANRGGSI